MWRLLKPRAATRLPLSAEIDAALEAAGIAENKLASGSHLAAELSFLLSPITSSGEPQCTGKHRPVESLVHCLLSAARRRNKLGKSCNLSLPSGEGDVAPELVCTVDAVCALLASVTPALCS